VTPTAPERSWWRAAAPAILIAAAVTLLNAIKPPVIDDPTYIVYAREFAAHPSHPYDFTYAGRPANETLVPPVLPAWLATGVAIFGDDPVALKLWLFPIILIFTLGLHALLLRFAPGADGPLLLLTAFSPAVLPSVNLMLDVPALGLGLAAVALSLRAAERGSLCLALTAGLLAGLAMETKYTAFVLPGVFLAHGWLNRDLRRAVVAATAAVAVFVGCEGLIALAHGQSHFLLAMRGHDRTYGPKPVLGLLQAAVTTLGGVGPFLVLIGLAALGVPRRTVLLLVALLVAGYVALAFVPEADAVLLRDPGSGRPWLILNHVVFVPPGLALGAVLLVIGWKAARQAASGSERRDDLFLVMWLVLEVGGYVVLSPFPAVRRVLGILAAATLLVGRMCRNPSPAPSPLRGGGDSAQPPLIVQPPAPPFPFREGGPGGLGSAPHAVERAQPNPPPPLPEAGRGERHRAPARRLITQLAVAGACLGLLYQAIDIRDAWAEQEALRRAAEHVRRHDPEAVIRYAGRWGFAHHAESAGLTLSREAGRDVGPGEWLIFDARYDDPLDPEALARLVPVGRFAAGGGPPVSTQRTYYGGRTPLTHFAGPHMDVVIYRRPAD
jgi:hypothetical protein